MGPDEPSVVEDLVPYRRPLPFRKFTPIPVPDRGDAYHNEKITLSSICPKCKEFSTWLHGRLKTEEKFRSGRSTVLKKMGGVRYRLFNYEFKHYDNLKVVATSSAEGCHLCTIWLDTIFNDPYYSSELAVPADFAHGSQLKLRRGSPNQAINLIDICVNDWVLNIGAELRLTTSTNRAYDQPSALSHTGYAIESTVSTNSKESFTTMRAWMDECAYTHPRCNLQAMSMLPTRLIQVCRDTQGSESTALRCKLVITKDHDLPITTRYAALSYCWGKVPAIELKLANYDELMTGFSSSSLPKTISDAVEVTTELGITWLWVDALCIIQDSANDWNDEVKRMHDVYAGCFVCLAAVGASNKQEGLFSLRDPLKYAPCHLFEQVAVSSLDSNKHADNNHERYPWPLEKRGWVLQEQILPPRKICFGTTISWECRALKDDEYHNFYEARNKKLPSPGGDGYRTLFHGFCNIIVLKHADGLYDNGERMGQVYLLWRKLVQEFSNAELTNKSDRQAAFTAIATAFQSRTPSIPFGGLWVRWLTSELLWRPAYDGTDKLHGSGLKTGLQPSWSWVSLDVGINDDWCNRYGDTSWEFDRWRQSTRDEQTYKLTRFQFPSTSPPVLEMTCPPIRFRPSLGATLHGNCGHGYPEFVFDVPKFPHLTFTGSYDTRNAVHAKADLLLPLVCVKIHSNHTLQVHGLIVEPSEPSVEGVQFKRVGTWHVAGIIHPIPFDKVESLRILARVSVGGTVELDQLDKADVLMKYLLNTAEWRPFALI